MQIHDSFSIKVIPPSENFTDIEEAFVEELESVLTGKTQEGQVHALRSILGDTMGSEILHKIDTDLKGRAAPEKVKALKSCLFTLAFRYRQEQEVQESVENNGFSQE